MMRRSRGAIWNDISHAQAALVMGLAITLLALVIVTSCAGPASSSTAATPTRPAAASPSATGSRVEAHWGVEQGEGPEEFRVVFAFESARPYALRLARHNGSTLVQLPISGSGVYGSECMAPFMVGAKGTTWVRMSGPQLREFVSTAPALTVLSEEPGAPAVTLRDSGCRPRTIPRANLSDLPGVTRPSLGVCVFSESGDVAIARAAVQAALDELAGAWALGPYQGAPRLPVGLCPRTPVLVATNTVHPKRSGQGPVGTPPTVPVEQVSPFMLWVAVVPPNRIAYAFGPDPVSTRAAEENVCFGHTCAEVTSAIYTTAPTAADPVQIRLALLRGLGLLGPSR